MVALATALALQLPHLHKFWGSLPTDRSTVVIFCADTPPCHKEFVESRKLQRGNPDIVVLFLDYEQNRALANEMLVEQVPSVFAFSGRTLVWKDKRIDQTDLLMALTNRGSHAKGQ
jgi:hypothetical protein